MRNAIKPDLSRVGGAGAALRAATVGAAFALLGAVVWVSVAALRPMPEPEIAEPPAPATIAAPALASATLESRDRLLGALASAGNIFAPDRLPWPAPKQEAASGDTAEAAPDSSSPTAAATPASAPVKIGGGAASAPAYDSIPVSAAPPPAIERDLKKLRLRGVYRDGGSRVALITGAGTPPNSARAQPRRVGETFGEESWTVVAIDDARPRVILSRAGVNVELAMRDLGDAIARTSSRPAVAQPAPPPVVVHTRTVEQARAELLAAGVDPALVEETLSLSADIAIAGAPEPARAPTIESIPRASEEMMELLKMMSAGSGAPTTRVVPPQFRGKEKNEEPPGK